MNKFKVSYTRPSTDIPWWDVDASREYIEEIHKVCKITHTESDDGLTRYEVMEVEDEMIPAWVEVREKFSTVREMEYLRKLSLGFVYGPFTTEN